MKECADSPFLDASLKLSKAIQFLVDLAFVLIETLTYSGEVSAVPMASWSLYLY